MLDNLAVVGLIVVVLWIIILSLFIVISRRQPDVQAQMKALDEQLNHIEHDTFERDQA